MGFPSTGGCETESVVYVKNHEAKRQEFYMTSIEEHAGGFSGMTLAEAPIHIGILIVNCIITLIGVILAFWVVMKSKGDYRTFRFFSFLAFLCVFLTFVVLAYSFSVLPAAATVDQLLPYTQWAWSLVGLYGLFLVYYLFWPSIKERIWLAILFLLGTISYLAVVWLIPTPLTVFTVSDGVVNYVVMPLIVIGYGGFLGIIYIFLIPLLAIYNLAKQRDGAQATWTWVSWLGLLLWFIAIMLMAFVQYTAPYMLYIFGLSAFAFILMFIAAYFIRLPME